MHQSPKHSRYSYCLSPLLFFFIDHIHKVLIKNNILAAPVFDYAKNQYCSMFSMRDVLLHALRVLDETKFENGMAITSHVASL